MKKTSFIQQTLVLIVGLFFIHTMNANTGYSTTNNPRILPYETLHQLIGEPYKGYKLTLKDQTGKTIKMHKLEGKVVFINFWATWCPPCIAEMPNINKLYQEYEDDDEVVFLMVSLDKNFKKAVNFREKKEYSFDIHQTQSPTPRDLQTRGIPNTFVLGKTGEIEYKKIGMGNYNTTKFKDFLEELKAK